jgi:hypothetical protein
MIVPEFIVTASTQRLTLRFEELPRALRNAIRPRIVALSATLLGLVHAAEPRRTGKLRSMTHAFLRERKNSIRGGVTIDGTDQDPNKVAAGALEYGVHRTVSVKGHSARLTEVFGRTVTPETVLIRTHARRANLTARRFLRGPASALLPRARAELETAIAEAIAKSFRSR